MAEPAQTIRPDPATGHVRPGLAGIGSLPEHRVRGERSGQQQATARRPSSARRTRRVGAERPPRRDPRPPLRALRAVDGPHAARPRCAGALRQYAGPVRAPRRPARVRRRLRSAPPGPPGRRRSHPAGPAPITATSTVSVLVPAAKRVWRLDPRRTGADAAGSPLVLSPSPVRPRRSERGRRPCRDTVGLGAKNTDTCPPQPQSATIAELLEPTGPTTKRWSGRVTRFSASHRGGPASRRTGGPPPRAASPPRRARPSIPTMSRSCWRARKASPICPGRTSGPAGTAESPRCRSPSGTITGAR